MIDILTLKEGDVVYLHPPANLLQDHYACDDFYDTIGVVKHTPDLHSNYARIKISEHGGLLYHGGEITKIGEL